MSVSCRNLVSIASLYLPFYSSIAYLNDRTNRHLKRTTVTAFWRNWSFAEISQSALFAMYTRQHHTSRICRFLQHPQLLSLPIRELKRHQIPTAPAHARYAEASTTIVIWFCGPQSKLELWCAQIYRINFFALIHRSTATVNLSLSYLE